jgi:ribosome-binding protein aMBF1 (putative translation factor)
MTVDVHDTRTLGRLVRRARRSRGLTQIELARTAGLGERFIVDLERGKATCEIGPTADLERDLPRPRRPRRTSKTAP